MQLRIPGADHPQQATQPALFQVDLVAGKDPLGLAGHDNQRGTSPSISGELPGDTHHMLDVRIFLGMCVRVAVLRRGKHHHLPVSSRPELGGAAIPGVGPADRPRNGQDIVVHCVSCTFNASVNCVAPIRSAASLVLINSQVPGLGMYLARAALALGPLDGQQPLAQHPIALALPGMRQCPSLIPAYCRVRPCRARRARRGRLPPRRSRTRLTVV